MHANLQCALYVAIVHRTSSHASSLVWSLAQSENPVLCVRVSKKEFPLKLCRVSGYPKPSLPDSIFRFPLPVNKFFKFWLNFSAKWMEVLNFLCSYWLCYTCTFGSMYGTCFYKIGYKWVPGYLKISNFGYPVPGYLKISNFGYTVPEYLKISNFGYTVPEYLFRF